MVQFLAAQVHACFEHRRVVGCAGLAQMEAHGDLDDDSEEDADFDAGADSGADEDDDDSGASDDEDEVGAHSASTLYGHFVVDLYEGGS